MVELAVPAVAPGREDALRSLQLRRARRRATGLLAVMATVYLAATVLGGDGGVSELVRAAAEGALVGGLADWFAVTALFRHPLGLPIPHTAVIAARKDQFGQAIGAFVQENFLHPDVLAERIRSARAVPRAGAWLAEKRNAEVVAGHVGDVAVRLTQVVGDEEMQGVLTRAIEQRVRALPLAPLLAKALRAATQGGRDQELFDAILAALQRALDDNRPALLARFLDRSPWWLPERLDQHLFDRLFDSLLAQLSAAGEDPDHELRRQFRDWIAGLTQRLETSPDLAHRAEQIARDLLSQPELRDWSASLWGELKATLRSQAGDPDSELRRRLVEGLVTVGRRLENDRELGARVERQIESRLRSLAGTFHDEAAELVSGTVARWDAGQTSAKLELLLGRDLQFIRINGTVVGGLAGLAIHLVGRMVG